MSFVKQRGNMLQVPLGVRMLAVMQILYGSVVLVVQGFNGNIGVPVSICTPIRGCGGMIVTYPYLMFVLISLGLIPIIAGWGIWFKKTWGWWMTAGYLFYLLLSEIGKVVDAWFRSSVSTDISLFYIGIVTLFLAYLLKKRVIRTFEVTVSKVKIMVWLFGASLLVSLLYEGVLFISSV